MARFLYALANRLMNPLSFESIPFLLFIIASLRLRSHLLRRGSGGESPAAQLPEPAANAEGPHSRQAH
jgi:hypothetical protein